MRKYSKLLLLPVLLLTLAAGGCATWDNIKTVVSAATTTIVNPVDSVDIYRIKNVYAATLKVMDNYRSYCEPKLYAEILADPVARPICKDRRKIIRAMIATGQKARDAIAAAERFVRDHPTFNAADAIRAAWDAVQNFQRAAPAPAPA